MKFSFTNSKLVYSLESLPLKPTQDNCVVYLTMLAPYNEIGPQGCIVYYV